MSEPKSPREVGKILTDPTGVSGVLVGDYLASQIDDDGRAGIIAAIEDQTKAVSSGDLSGMEAVLVGQVFALNAMFADFSRRAALNRAEHPQAMERYARLGLKAQAQCRATVEALAEMKNPPVVFARTANVASGHQQVNNYGADDGHARSIESAAQPHASGSGSTGKRAALPGPDPLGNAVSICGNAERPVSNARRQVAGRAKGKPERLEARRKVGGGDARRRDDPRTGK